MSQAQPLKKKPEVVFEDGVMPRDRISLPKIRGPKDLKPGMVFRHPLFGSLIRKLLSFEVHDEDEMDLKWEPHPDDCTQNLRSSMRWSAFCTLVLQDFLDGGRFPHKCPRCGSPAYVGACSGAAVDCTNDTCPTRKR